MARARKKKTSKRKQNQGRQYAIEEWPEFISEGYADGEASERDISMREVMDVAWESSELDRERRRVRDLAKKYLREANRVVKAWVRANQDRAVDLVESSRYESEHDIAYNTWAAIEGEGVGFWEDMDRADWESLRRAIHSDPKLRKLHFELQGALMGLVFDAAGIVDGTIERTKKNLQEIRVLWRQPDTMALWGIPYTMRPGQQPYDLHRAGNTRGWIWLGSPGWWGRLSRKDQEEIRRWLATLDDIPEGPAEWVEIQRRTSNPKLNELEEKWLKVAREGGQYGSRVDLSMISEADYEALESLVNKRLILRSSYPGMTATYIRLRRPRENNRVSVRKLKNNPTSKLKNRLMR